MFAVLGKVEMVKLNFEVFVPLGIKVFVSKHNSEKWPENNDNNDDNDDNDDNDEKDGDNDDFL